MVLHSDGEVAGIRTYTGVGKGLRKIDMLHALRAYCSSLFAFTCEM